MTGQKESMAWRGHSWTPTDLGFGRNVASIEENGRIQERTAVVPRKAPNKKSKLRNIEYCIASQLHLGETTPECIYGKSSVSSTVL